MTPQDKAKELVDKYATYAVMWTGGIEVETQNCKQCALIAVDELIKIAPWGGDCDEQIEPNSKEYFVLVRREIENL